MPTWLIVLILLIGFFAWTGWVLHKRSPNRPGEDTPRKDMGIFGSGN